MHDYPDSLSLFRVSDSSSGKTLILSLYSLWLSEDASSSFSSSFFVSSEFYVVVTAMSVSLVSFPFLFLLDRSSAIYSIIVRQTERPSSELLLLPLEIYCSESVLKLLFRESFPFLLSVFLDTLLMRDPGSQLVEELFDSCFDSIIVFVKSCVGIRRRLLVWLPHDLSSCYSDKTSLILSCSVLLIVYSI